MPATSDLAPVQASCIWEQRSAEYIVWANSCLPPNSVYKVLLEHSYTHIYVLSMTFTLQQ